MSRHHRWLAGELGAWQAEGLIDARQLNTLRERYPVAAEVFSGRLMLSALGAVIFGLGVILHFAYNWDDMSKLAKLAIIIGSLIASHGAAYGLSVRGRGSQASIESLHLLGTMFFGAGIWLISQIYQFEIPYPGALLVWGLGALAVAWALPSIPQGLMALTLISAWCLSDVEIHSSANYLGATLVAIGILPLGIWRRSKTILFLGAAAFLVLLTVGVARELDEQMIYVAFFLAAGFSSFSLLGRASGRPELASIAVVGQIVFVPALLVFSFERPMRELIGHPPESGIQQALFASSFVVGLGLLGVAMARSVRSEKNKVRATERWSSRLQVVVIATLVLVVSLIPFGNQLADPQHMAWLFSFMLLAHGVLMILLGASRQSRLGVTAGCISVIAVTLVRFIDLFESLLSRSLAFLLLGLGFFAVGAIYKRFQLRTEVNHA